MTTQRYVDLDEELYDSTPRETMCSIALNIQEAKKLTEQGINYETGEYNDGENYSTTTSNTPRNFSKPIGNPKKLLVSKKL